MFPLFKVKLVRKKAIHLYTVSVDKAFISTFTACVVEILNLISWLASNSVSISIRGITKQIGLVIGIIDQ